METYVYSYIIREKASAHKRDRRIIMPKPFIPRDKFARLARHEGYLARSAYKLEEIIRKFKVIKPNDKILDLGAAPGSWLQVAHNVIGAKGLAVGVDINPIVFDSPGVIAVSGDILNADCLAKVAAYGPYDAVLSDLAPKTSGIKDRDQALSQELSEQAAKIAMATLKKHGNLVIKVFQNPETFAFNQYLKTVFRKVRTYKPQASRDRSFETYLIGLDKID